MGCLGSRVVRAHHELEARALIEGAKKELDRARREALAGDAQKHMPGPLEYAAWGRKEPRRGGEEGADRALGPR